MYKIVYLHKASKELYDAIFWYDDKQQGLGNRFLNEVQKKLAILEKQPDRFAIKYKDHREVHIQNFPFIIVYKINESKKMVIVKSVFHTSRNPKNKY